MVAQPGNDTAEIYAEVFIRATVALEIPICFFGTLVSALCVVHGVVCDVAYHCRAVKSHFRQCDLP